MSLVLRKPHQIGDDRVGRLPDGKRVGEHDGRLDEPELFDLGVADELPESISEVHGSRNFLLKEVPLVRDDGGDSSPDGVPLPDRHLSHPDSRDVRDRVESSRGKDTRCETDVAGAGPRRSIGLGLDGRGYRRCEQRRGKSW
jgi:hypothetical protein